MCLAYFIQNKSFENEWMLFYFIQQIAYLHNCKSKTTTSRREEIKEKKKKVSFSLLNAQRNSRPKHSIS